MAEYAPAAGAPGVRARRLRTAAAVVPVATALAVLSQWPVLTRAPDLGVVNTAAAVSLITTGVVHSLVHSDRPGRRATGRGFAVAGGLWLIAWWRAWQLGPFPLLSATVGQLTFAAGAWAVLRHPDPRLVERREKVLVAVLAGWLGGFPLIMALTSRPGWYGFRPGVWWPGVVRARGVFAVETMVYDGVGTLLAVAATVMLLARIRRVRALDRVEITPFAVGAAGVAALGGAVLAGNYFHLPARDLETAYLVEGCALLAVPAGFLLSLLRRRFGRLKLAELVLRVAEPATTRSVRASLREALDDPDLDLLQWVPAAGLWIDADGVLAPLPAGSDQRHVLEVPAADGSPLAAVVTHPSLLRRPDLMEAAVAASRMALENSRLQETVLSQLAQVSESRARIVETAFATRRAFERDLHDGAQQRLLSIRLMLGAARAKITDPAVLEVLDGGRAELGRALAELRGLARGVHPPVLGQSGLAAALEGVVEELPLVVDVVVPARRFSPAVESTAYYVASEGLTNVALHAGTTRASLYIRAETAQLVVEVTDRGSGGADTARGRSLADIADRVAGLGGRMTVDSRPGHGTHLSAHIPIHVRPDPRPTGTRGIPHPHVPSSDYGPKAPSPHGSGTP